MLKTDTKGKLQDILDKVVKESKKKGLTINCKKTEKAQDARYKLEITQNFKYLESFLTDGKKTTDIPFTEGFLKLFESQPTFIKRNLSLLHLN